MRFGSALATGQTVDDVVQWPERVQAVTREQVLKAAQAVLRGDHEWLEQGIIRWDETHDPERRSSVPPETPEPVVLGVGG